MKLKIYLLAFLIGASVFSCKKLVQQQELNIATQIITNGQWYVKTYLNDSVDVSSIFDGYVFQFNKNGTVVGTRDSVSVSGTWSASITNHTITSNFPGASSPLNKLNSVWKITDSSLDYVVANASISDSTENLRLQKK
jgi:hypothetical protein